MMVHSSVVACLIQLSLRSRGCRVSSPPAFRCTS